MQEDYYAAYREYLRPGMRIEIGIPLVGGGVFRDWAIVQESREDELQVQISRDVLPANVRVDVGFILDVSIWVGKEAYTCSGIVTDKQGGRVLGVRLFGAFTLQERRQFFRIDLFLRIRYALFSNPDHQEVQQDWEQRKNLEQMKFQGYDNVVIAAQQSRYRPAIELEWHDILQAEVNLSGGGLLLRLPEPVHAEKLMALDITLPLRPPRQVQAIVETIHELEPLTGRDGAPFFRVGVRFLFLDERDRDLIFRHISVTQIDLLRKAADRREPPHPKPEQREPVPLTWQRLLPRLLWGLLFVLLFFTLARYLIRFREAGNPNEIKQTYEKAIKKYRHEDR